MNLFDTYKNADNAERQEMFYRFLKKSELTESTSRQYAKTYPKHAVVLSNVNEVSKKTASLKLLICHKCRPFTT